MAAFTTLALELLVGAAAKPPVSKPTPTRKRGRPRTPPQVAARRSAASTLLTKPRRGAPVKITPDDEQWFLAEVDAWKARLAVIGLTCSDSDALRLSIAAHYVKQCTDERLLDDATRLARWVTAIGRITGSDDARGRTITVACAVLLHTRRLFTEAHITAGLTRDEAGRRAQRTALELVALFGTRKGTLSRLRKQRTHARR